MCGLAGVIDRSGIRHEGLSLAAEAIRHRGPDDVRTWIDGSIGLAHARLAIIDRARGSQPLVSHGGRLITVFNGEIYNHHALRQELAADGCRFETACDTEVLPYLYDRLGPSMVDEIDGMFALAIVDRQTNDVFVARDRFGKKPLYHTTWTGGFAFASTLDALLHVMPERPDLDRQSIAEYMVLQYVPAARTPWSRVHKLEPGSWLRWRSGEVEIRRFWTPPIPGRNGQRSQPAELRKTIREAVARRLESEVPLGVFLSGGMDSSVVVAEMAELGVRSNTFSVGFSRPELDETTFAKRVATAFGTRHVELRPDDDVTTLFDELIRRYDEPFADSSALATLAVARAAKPHVTVVLTGDGGDELFGGYDRYRAFEAASRIQRLAGVVARPLARGTSAAARLVGSSRVEALSAFVRDPWTGYRDRMFHFAPDEVRRLLVPSWAEAVDTSAPVRRLDDVRSRAGDVAWMAGIDARTYLPDDLLTKMDRATMAVGIEARAPFLDHHLWAYVATLEQRNLVTAKAGKIALRDAYRGILPDEVLDRRKMGFGVPLGDWLRGPLRLRMCDLLLSETGPLTGICRIDVVRDLARSVLEGDDSVMYRVWNLVAFAGWWSERGR